jgi:hypothetical protein
MEKTIFKIFEDVSKNMNEDNKIPFSDVIDETIACYNIDCQNCNQICPLDRNQ